MDKTLAAFGVMLSGAFAYCFFRLRERATRNQRLASRERLPLGQIFLESYRNVAGDKERLAEIWLAVAACLQIDPQKMRPGDQLLSFAGDIGRIGDFPGSSLDDLTTLIETRLTAARRDCPNTLETIDDVVRLLLSSQLD